jgi:ribosomal protein S27E
MPDQFCPACNKETFVIKEAVYEGFTRIGERMKCAVCGHLFEPPTETAPVKKTPDIFSEDDKSPVLNVFGEGENRVICRYCKHYLVNPFKQWCGFHKKEVEATDTCSSFSVRETKTQT